MSELYPNLTKENLETSQKVLQELFVVNDFRFKDMVGEDAGMFLKTTLAIQEALEAIAFELEIVEQDAMGRE